MIGDPDVTLRVDAVLSHLKLAGPVMAEVGVNDGAMSLALLSKRPDLYLYMIDSYPSGALWPYWTAYTITEFANNRRTFMVMDSLTAVKRVPQLDCAFIDADHRYEAVKPDTEAWFAVLKPGGVLCGHDYDPAGKETPGVKQAVIEFVYAHKLALELGPNTTWFVRKNL